MTLYQTKRTAPNERAMRDMINARYHTLGERNPPVPKYPRPGFVTKLMTLVREEGAGAQKAEQRLRIAGTLWAVSQVVGRDLVADDEPGD